MASPHTVINILVLLTKIAGSPMTQLATASFVVSCLGQLSWSQPSLRSTLAECLPLWKKLVLLFEVPGSFVTRTVQLLSHERHLVTLAGQRLAITCLANPRT
jgi:hypothetical protein